MKTTQEIQAELASVRQAIQAAYGSKSYSVTTGGTARQLERQPLDVLLRREADLERQLQRMGGGGITYGVPMP